jgi:hypothetical protein
MSERSLEGRRQKAEGRREKEKPECGKRWQ